MAKFKKSALSIVSVGLAACFTTGIASMAMANTNYQSGVASAYKEDAITRINDSVDTRLEDFFDGSNVHRLSDNVKENQEISVILSMKGSSQIDEYVKSGSKESVASYLQSSAAKSLAKKNKAARNELVRTLSQSKISYKLGMEYDTVLSGFEVTLKAKDYYALAKAVGDKAKLIVGEVYAPAEAEVVTNEVDVYETGIFNSSSCEHQGDGVVVAVLDTGLDYSHSAFSADNFTSTNVAFTPENVAQKVNNLSLRAKETTSGLTGSDVYISKKVPYAYDYADKDPDVAPINSEHGTHVAGVIAGKDRTITGVAPNAQLAIMKVFSDYTTGARTSWLLAALEDCVKLEVDVINMSLGSGAGFTTQNDEQEIADVYDSIKAAGISLITAAGNDYNATFGSDKNGSNPLTYHPDSGVVGSPSTYEAALSVASVGGVKTPYFLYNGEIMYFTEASTSSAKNRNFVEDILKTVGNVDSYDFEYVTIPGIGRRTDYPENKEFYKNKIVLVKRGTTTFEEKVDIAIRVMGAAGIIIYNNVSGTISMSIGESSGAVCSISQDHGEKLAAAQTGILRISRDQMAGPFMSDFSSWGPTSDLRIKPEITAHGGEILSAVPGGTYEKLSGTSMAAPNMAGAAALIRQYVKSGSDKFGNLDAVDVTARVNQLAMSTADIVRNKNGLAYSVRKQGAGLVNIAKATSAAAYISTFKNGVEMDKSKLELGDDKNKTGVYTMSFVVNNITNSPVSYNVNSIVMTEGISPTYTSHDDQTVTQDGYLLSPDTEITSVSGGSNSGNTVNVPAKGSATVNVKITLSGADKDYLNEYFKYGMYVEGFITLEAASNTSVNLNVPFLAFYGDWTESPIFDEEYYDTNVDELNAGLDTEDKLMADAYATRVIGGFYSDYIFTLGSYPFVQNPSATQVSANKEHIALSNYENERSGAVNKLNSVWAGLMRNVKYWQLEIVEDSTGNVIFEKYDYNQHKSYSSGSRVYQSDFKIDFDVLQHNLKNNTKYTVNIKTFIDYGNYTEDADGYRNYTEQKNVRNTFSFPLYIDFEAPIVTGVEYRTEYDRSTKKTRLYADVSVYDNHYAMAVQFGQIKESAPGSEYKFTMNSFGKYITPVFSSYNSTSKVTIELTDYLEQIKESAGIKYNADGTSSVVVNNNCFIATCYDYAMNTATYELKLPDEILGMYFDVKENEIKLSPNETLDLTSVINVYPSESWKHLLDFTSSDSNVVKIVNQSLIALNSGEATITATGKDANGNTVSASVNVRVLAQGEPGYKRYDPPQANKAKIAQYETLHAFYSVSSDEREIGVTGGTYDFGNQFSLSMFPSESVKIHCEIETYFPENSRLVFSSTRKDNASVTADGVVVAHKKGNASISVTLEVTTNNKKSTYFVGTVDITVKDPYTTNSIYLMSYKGNGGEVVIPSDRGITTIQSYAFSGYEYVEKDVNNGDEISKEDPYKIKQMYLGDNTITKVVIPEGVTKIESYAFANLTALEEVVFPTTLTNIGLGAFLGCTNLKKANFDHVKFVNSNAFLNCAIEEAKFDSIYAIGANAFEGNNISSIDLPKTAQSLDSGAFRNNTLLSSVNFRASKIKIGDGVFVGCSSLTSVKINAAVIPSRAFFGCSKLEDVELGKDVAVIGEEAFGGTAVSAFKLRMGSKLKLSGGGKFVLDENNKLILVAPKCGSTIDLDEMLENPTEIASGAFAGNGNINTVIGLHVTKIGDYAFADCISLQSVNFPLVEEIGNYAFYNTIMLQETPSFENITKIGDFAFALSKIKSVEIPDDAVVGKAAFARCTSLTDVTIGDDVTIGEQAFFNVLYNGTYEATGNFNNYIEEAYTFTNEKGESVTYAYLVYNFAAGATSNITSLTIGKRAKIQDYAFAYNTKLSSISLDEGAEIGDYAFMGAFALEEIDLSKAVSIGESAFAGIRQHVYWKYRDTYRYAYNFEVVDGQLLGSIKYTSFGPQLQTANLSSATKVGAGAFAYNEALKSVTLNGNLQSIAQSTFFQCKALETLKNTDTEHPDGLPQAVQSVGALAFTATKIASFNLENVNEIGAYAFALTGVEEIELKDGAFIGSYAFYNCKNLAVADNLENVNEIGAYAFAKTALTEIDLKNVLAVGDFAFGESQLTSVSLGNSLVYLGENPFYGCNLTGFEIKREIKFNDVVVAIEKVDTYDVSETVKVIDNAIYLVVPKGLQLVCYPIGMKADSFTVADGTVRISARAFEGATLANVTLPHSLKAIGDKAFYNCEDLTTVIFKSYNAPILEEEYDENYLTYGNLPISGSLGGYEGLGISDYYMWNSTSPNNFYFGANFVDYVGKYKPRLVMVSPANGVGYNTFIFNKYFNVYAAGGNAMTEETIRVIALINAIDSYITLESEAKVLEARRAYDALPGLEQKALVENYSKLTNAENIIMYLKSSIEEPEAPAPAVEEGSSVNALGVAGFTIAGVLLLALAGLLVYMLLTKKKAKASVAAEDGAAEYAEERQDAAEETAETAEAEDTQEAEDESKEEADEEKD